MPERIKTAVVVTLITVVVWFFAESSSVGDASQTLSIQFTASGTDQLLYVADPSWENQVAVVVRGSRSAIAAVRQVFQSPLNIVPGEDGMRTTSGPVDMATVLAAHPTVSQTGVSIIEVRPPIVDVIIQSVETRLLPIRPRLERVQVDGDVLVTPDQVQVRAPAQLWNALGQSVFITALLDDSQLESLPSAGQVSQSARLELPPALQNQRGVELLSSSATLSFSIKARFTTESFSAVPVWVVSPPVEWADWQVTINPDDQFLAIELRAPADVFNAMKQAGDRPIAVLYLSSDDLVRRTTSKVVSFMLLRKDGSIASMPPSVTVNSTVAAVRFEVIPREQP